MNINKVVLILSFIITFSIFTNNDSYAQDCVDLMTPSEWNCGTWEYSQTETFYYDELEPNIIWQKDINDMETFNHFIDPFFSNSNIDNDTLIISYLLKEEDKIGILKLDLNGNFISKNELNLNNDKHKELANEDVIFKRIIINDSLYNLYYEFLTPLGPVIGMLRFKKNGQFIGRFPLDTNQKMGANQTEYEFIFNDTLYMPSLSASFDSVGNKHYYIFYDVFDENMKRLDPLFIDTNQFDYKIHNSFWLSDYTKNRFIMPVVGPENYDRQYSVFCKTDRKLNVLEQKKVSIPGYYGFYHEQILSIREDKIYCTGVVTEKDTLIGDKVFFVLDTNFNLLSYKVWENEFIKRLSIKRAPHMFPVNNHNNYLVYSFVSEGYNTEDGMVPFGLVLMDSECNVLETYEWSINDEAHDKFKAIYEVTENEYIGLTWAGMLMKFSLPVTSVKSNNLNEEVVKLYPSPAKDELNITIEDEYFTAELECSIISIDGQTVKNFNMRSNNKMLPVNTLPNGIYFLQIKGLYKSSLAIKFIIER